MGAISRSLKKLAEDLQAKSDEVLERAEENPELFQAVAVSVADAVLGLEKAAEIISEHEPQFSAEELDGLVTLASALDKQDDPELRKQADVLDEILYTVGGKEKFAQEKARGEDEIARLRAKYREEATDTLYSKVGDEQARQRRSGDMAAAVKEQVKEFRTMSHALSTRYCPDHPGVSISRIADRVYQCSLDHKVYNFETGYTTAKGNKVPGGGVDMQTPDWGHRDRGHVMFSTRENLTSRAGEESDELVKKADTDETK